MKPIVMPVRRLTADCIWNSFLNSGKKHLILTGGRGSGKSTLLSELFPEEMPGITTFSQPGSAVYLKENLTGETVKVGEFDSSLSGEENKMVYVSGGFTSLGVQALELCSESDSPWVTVDEIGYLEAGCKEYLDALYHLMNIKQVAAVVRKQNLPFINGLCSREDTFVADLDNPFGNIGCVIMASGVSKRFGGNKLTALFRGKPMISYVLDATENIFEKRVVVTRHKEVAELCRKRGVDTVFHNLPHRNDTVRLGLEALEGVDRCMFVPADQPLLSRETVASVALAAVNDKNHIWRTACGDTCGMPVIFPERFFDELMNLPEAKGGGAVIKKYPGLLRTVNISNIYELKDIDFKEDLEEMQKL